MTEQGQTSLGLIGPDGKPVTPKVDSGSIEAVQTPGEGGSGMGDKARQDPSGLEEAREIARLSGSEDPKDQQRLAKIRQKQKNRQLRESGLISPQGISSLGPDKQLRHKEPIVYGDPETARRQRAERKAQRGKN